MMHGILINRPKYYPVESYCRILQSSVYLEGINQCLFFFSFSERELTRKENIKDHTCGWVWLGVVINTQASWDLSYVPLIDLEDMARLKIVRNETLRIHVTFLTKFKSLLLQMTFLKIGTLTLDMSIKTQPKFALKIFSK